MNETNAVEFAKAYLALQQAKGEFLVAKEALEQAKQRFYEATKGILKIQSK